MLDRIKQLLGLATVDGHEREVLEREYLRIEKKLDQTKKRIDQVHCVGCAKEEDPQAKRLLSKRSRLEKRQQEIEAKLGGVPEQVRARRKRRASSRRASA